MRAGRDVPLLYGQALSAKKGRPGTIPQVEKMNTEHENSSEARPEGSPEEREDLDQALVQMEVLYRSRCVQAPHGNNVTVREINREE